LTVATSVEGAVPVPKRYPEQFRRKVLDLVAAGRPIAQIAADQGISDQTIYGWRKQERIDTGTSARSGTPGCRHNRRKPSA
jgi:transposase-like protein